VNNLTAFPFLASISLFGTIAIIVVSAYSALNSEAPIKSDDPYIIAFAFSSIMTFTGFIFFVLKELELKWLKPIPSLLTYYLLLIIFSFLVEYNGGEGAGFGYLFITGIALLTPILLIFICYSNNSKLLFFGLICSLLYLIGYLVSYFHCCA